MKKDARRTFVLLSTQRSGTGFLATSLESHPDISNLSELFRPRNQTGASYRTYRARTLTRLGRHLLSRRSLIDEYLAFRLASEPERIFGFILMYGQAETYPQVIQWCLDNDVHIIRMTRRNILKSLVSREIAKKRRIFNSSVKPPPAIVRIDPSNLVRRLDQTSSISKKYTEIFRNGSYMEVEYEDFCVNTRAVGDRVLDFLGARRVPLEARTVKVNSNNLSDLIENYEEVRSALLGTAYEKLLN